MRVFNISLTVLLFVLLGFITALLGSITFQALGIPAKNTSSHNNLRELNSKMLSPNSKGKLGKLSKEQVADQALIKGLQAKALLDKKPSDNNMENQANIVSESEEHNVSGNINAQVDKNLSKELFLYSRQDNSNISTEKLKIDSKYASQTIYTIQIGSLNSLTEAEKHFDSTIGLLNENELDLLRIEKIGKNLIHTIRLGKFENYKTAKKILQDIKPRIPDVIILKAYLKKERIVRLYGAE